MNALHRTALLGACLACWIPPAGADDGRQGIGDRCVGCHAGADASGGIDLAALLDRLPTEGSVAGGTDHGAWLSVLRNLRAETMPPPDEPAVPAEERARLVAYVERDVFRLDPSRPDPGRVVLRRLNRFEYEHTVGDLTGLPLPLKDVLPNDDTGYGFDTVGEVLSMSPLTVEKYLALADSVGKTVVEVARPEAAEGQAAAYPVAVRRVFPFGPPPSDPAAVADHLARTVARLAERAFRGPVEEAVTSRLVGIAQAAMTVPDGGFERGVAAALTAALVSPRFLFRIEAARDPPADPPEPPPSAVPISDAALAARLSYFLWSSMPDDDLLAAALEGRLRGELDDQVTRMLADPKADRFTEHFVGQWLRTRDVESAPFDFNVVSRQRGKMLVSERAFHQQVRPAMQLETRMLFSHLLRENRPVADLLVGRETFLNEALATFYDIPDVEGPEMRLVSLAPDSHRGGLLTQGSLLAVTSNATRTSPVKRGQFVLDNLLGMPVPPPPPNIPPLEPAGSSAAATTMREKLDRHRQDPLCSSCHERMDSLGLALEEYNAIGQWLGPVGDPAASPGRLPTGETFADAAELAAIIAGPRRRNFERTLAEKLLIYALGRGLDYHDGPAVEAILGEYTREGGGLADLVRAVCRSVPFQMRRPPEISEMAP